MALTKVTYSMIKNAAANVSDFNAFSTPTERTNALQAALVAADTIIVNTGTYNYTTITQSNKTLYMQEGVIFKIPDGTVVAGDTSGPAVLQINGDNITIIGDFVIDGNRAHNDSVNFPTSVLTAALTIEGSNCRILGEARIDNAYYRGFITGTGLNSGNEIENFYATSIYVTDPNYYGVMMWAVKDWRVEKMTVIGGTPGTGRDQRIRLGTQGSATSQCLNGSVGQLYATNYAGLVIEANTDHCRIDNAVAAGGGKFQSCSNVSIGSLYAYAFRNTDDSIGWGFLSCVNCRVDELTVKNFDCQPGFLGAAVFIVDAVQCSAGAVYVSGTIANRPDVWIVRPDGVCLDSVVLVDPIGTGFGLFFDKEGPAPGLIERNVVINSLVSRGHQYDIVLESNDFDMIFIGKVNDDATQLYPNVLKQSYGSAAPTVNYWAEGCVVWNSSAAVGQPIGWMCTVSGTPGTWVAMVNL